MKLLRIELSVIKYKLLKDFMIIDKGEIDINGVPVLLQMEDSRPHGTPFLREKIIREVKRFIESYENKTNIKSLTGIQTNTVTYPANLSAEEDKDSLFLERIDADLLLKIEDKEGKIIEHKKIDIYLVRSETKVELHPLEG